jgi:hypothetical protein
MIAVTGLVIIILLFYLILAVEESGGESTADLIERWERKRKAREMAEAREEARRNPKPLKPLTEQEIRAWKANAMAGRSTVDYWGQMPPTPQSPEGPSSHKLPSVQGR